MSIPSQIDNKPIQSKQDLIDWFQKGCTPADRLLIGVEHEKPPFYYEDGLPVSYAGAPGRAGIKDFIDAMIARHGWQPGHIEDGNITEIHKNNVSWTFEPGLQMETGGAPLKNVHQISQETDEVLQEALDVAKSLGFSMLAQGYHPTHKGEKMPLMPKSRYALIRNFAKANDFKTAQDLMSCTSTVQVNMGYQSEEDMVKMLRVSLALQPVAVALFANSPFEEGKPSGKQSTRSRLLVNNFNGRYGFMLPIAFEEGFGFEMFVDYALKTMPMMGIYKGDVFIDAKGGKFEDFMKGELEACPGQLPTISDWQNHLNTIWPEVRLRRFLEMRGADNGPPEMIKALPAFWVGLLYDKPTLDKAYEMIKDWTAGERDYLRIMVTQTGLQTPFHGSTVQDLAKNCLALSEAGLKNRNVQNAEGQDESVYLAPLHEIADSGMNWARRLEARYNNEWGGDINRLFGEMDYAANPSVLRPAPEVPAAKPAARRVNGPDRPS